MSKQTENTNCLANFRCPKCGSLEPLKIAITAVTIWNDDGCDFNDIEYPEWEDDSYCECMECHHYGVVSDFSTEKMREPHTLSAIGKRAKELLDPLGLNRDVISWTMDIEKVHENTGLDLKSLLNATDEDFAHDLAGIAQYLNRTTGQLEDCFIPRFALSGKDKEED